MESEKSTSDRWKEAADIFTVVLLSLTAVFTAWCGFESSKWGGAMSISFSQASSARISAASFEGQARDNRALDLTVYAQWLEAKANKGPQYVEYIESRFRPDFVVAFEEWQATDMEALSPFALESYIPEGQEDAAKYSALADEKFQEALDNNQRGDDYSILTVLFALVLFFAAVSQRNTVPWTRWFLLALAVVAGTVATVIMTTLPVLV